VHFGWLHIIWLHIIWLHLYLQLVARVPLGAHSIISENQRLVQDTCRG
jgi:hypothetical protein